MPRQYTPRVHLVCPQCGKPYTVNAARAAQARYCSIDCKTIGRVIPIRDRLLKRGNRAANGCLLWAGFVAPSGYAQITIDQQHHLGVHVASYMEWVGPIPDGHQVQHLCDINYAPDDKTYRRCFEPTHLTTGTPKQNQEHMADAGRSLPGDAHGMAKLTDADVLEIRRRRTELGATYKILAQAFGVSVRLTWKVVHREVWKHI